MLLSVNRLVARKITQNYFCYFILISFFVKRTKKKKYSAYGAIQPNRKDFAVIADEKSFERGYFDFECTSDGLRDVAAALQTPNWGGGPGQLWGPKLI